MTDLTLLFPAIVVAAVLGYQYGKYRVMKDIVTVRDTFVHTKTLSPKSEATQMAVKLANEIAESGAIHAETHASTNGFPVSQIKLKIYVGD